MVRILMAIFSIQSVFCCNFNYFLTYEGRFCYDRNCTKGYITHFPLQLGQEACFATTDGENLKYKLNSIVELYYYKELYQTCTYMLDSDFYYRCWQAGTCWASSCNPNNIDDGGEFQIRPNSTLHYSSGCIKQGLCPGHCGWDQAERCGWYHAYIKEGTCYKVLALERREWEVKLLVVGAGSKEMFTLTNARPEVEKRQKILVNYASNSIILETDYKLLLMTPLFAIPIVANDIDITIPHSIGDYQKDLLGKTVKFPLGTLLRCYTESCVVKCDLPKSPLENNIKIINWIQRNDKVPVLNLHTDSRQYLRSKSIHSGLVSVYTSYKRIDHQSILKASCKTDFLFSQGCYGCSDPTTSILRGRNITQSGIMLIKSNCSIKPDYIRCQDDPYTVEILQGFEICYVEVLSSGLDGSISDAFYIYNNFTFYGDLDTIKYLSTTSVDESSSWSAVNLIGDSSFLHSLGSVFGVFAIVPLLLKAFTWMFPYLSAIFVCKFCKQDNK
ncbi:MAG: hypothetical protein FMLXV1_gp1 [Fushun monolepta lauta xinmovirus 1]|uniref:Glycoprotein n=1 Tax=Fushun monolepta lauta xinmovirus 1 TaxID=2905554 RepID=A0A8K1XGW4_9MONO|nr:MAG: hypothetical protein FMLXV1_gp1 [Fushun monolepta lauta xinmovirus 1]